MPFGKLPVYFFSKQYKSEQQNYEAVFLVPSKSRIKFFTFCEKIKKTFREIIPFPLKKFINIVYVSRYVLQIAIADSLFLLMLPFKLVEEYHGQWTFPEWFCKMNETILFLNYYSSIVLLTVCT